MISHLDDEVKLLKTFPISPDYILSENKVEGHNSIVNISNLGGKQRHQTIGMQYLFLNKYLPLLVWSFIIHVKILKSRMLAPNYFSQRVYF